MTPPLPRNNSLPFLWEVSPLRVSPSPEQWKPHCQVFAPRVCVTHCSVHTTTCTAVLQHLYYGYYGTMPVA